VDPQNPIKIGWKWTNAAAGEGEPYSACGETIIGVGSNGQGQSLAPIKPDTSCVRFGPYSVTTLTGDISISSCFSYDYNSGYLSFNKGTNTACEFGLSGENTAKVLLRLACEGAAGDKPSITVTLAESAYAETLRSGQVTFRDAATVAGKLCANASEIWKYRMPIRVTNPTTQTLYDYPVKVVFDGATPVSLGQMQYATSTSGELPDWEISATERIINTGRDLRLVPRSGFRSELPFWLLPNTLNTPQATFWFKVDSLAPGETREFDLLYGNPQAEGRSDLRFYSMEAPAFVSLALGSFAFHPFLNNVSINPLWIWDCYYSDPTNINPYTRYSICYQLRQPPVQVEVNDQQMSESVPLLDQLSLAPCFPAVTLRSPSAGAKVPPGSKSFFFTVRTSGDATLVNATLWTNASGSWNPAGTVLTTVSNTAPNNISLALTPNTYLWNVRVCDSWGLCAFAPSNRTVQVVDRTTPLYNFFRNTAQEKIGWSVSAGDLDGDGFADIAIGAPYAAVGTTTGAGKVYVYNGKTGQLMFELAASSTTIPTATTPTKDGHFGWVVKIDNLNDGQGMAILVSEPGMESGHLFSASGASRGRYKSNYYSFGKAFTTGDVNNDGKKEIIVGAPDWKSGSEIDRNTNGYLAVLKPDATLLFDVKGGSSRDTVQHAGYEESIRYGEKLGASVAAVQWDGAGGLEVLGGAPTRGKSNKHGYLRIFNGAGTDLGKTLDGTADDQIGWHGLAGGDLDGDGQTEVVTSSRNSPFLRVFEVDGTHSTGLENKLNNGLVAANKSGWSIALGDLNNDGYSDTAFGAPGGANINSWLGDDGTDDAWNNNGGFVRVHSGQPYSASGPTTGDVLYTVPGGATAGGFGYSLAIADVSGDGINDLVIGSPGLDTGNENTGGVFVYLGG
jgi:hypothetical protein